MITRKLTDYTLEERLEVASRLVQSVQAELDLTGFRFRHQWMYRNPIHAEIHKRLRNVVARLDEALDDLDWEEFLLPEMQDENE